ncbi:MAG: CopG family transcriptional regulator [Candidatus Kerfeldbacteria bacterium]|nr:CopG family transcriptional regulator [Candidatus Kerfeldbacteria bacterium]
MNTTISLPENLYKAIAERVADGQFPSVDAYVQYVLERVLASAPAAPAAENGLSQEQEQAVKARLKGLGYLE